MGVIIGFDNIKFSGSIKKNGNFILNIIKNKKKIKIVIMSLIKKYLLNSILSIFNILPSGLDEPFS